MLFFQVFADTVKAKKNTAEYGRFLPINSNKLTFDLLTLKVVSESRVTWATSVPILVFLGLSVLDLGLMNATDRRQTDRQTDRQTPDSIIALCPAYYGQGIKSCGAKFAGNFWRGAMWD